MAGLTKRKGGAPARDRATSDGSHRWSSESAQEERRVVNVVP